MSAPVLKLPRPPDFSDPYMTPSDDILVSVGYLVIAAAGPEDMLHHLFWQAAGLTEKCGPIITKDMRPSRMAEDIIKLASESNASDAKLAALKDVLSDLKKLIETRNKCIHWIWEFNKNGEHKITAPIYKSEKQKEISISPEFLSKLALDFAWIEARLECFIMDEETLIKKRSANDDLKDVFFPAPWL